MPECMLESCVEPFQRPWCSLWCFWPKKQVILAKPMKQLKLNHNKRGERANNTQEGPDRNRTLHNLEYYIKRPVQGLFRLFPEVGWDRLQQFQLSLSTMTTNFSCHSQWKKAPTLLIHYSSPILPTMSVWAQHISQLTNLDGKNSVIITWKTKVNTKWGNLSIKQNSRKKTYSALILSKKTPPVCKCKKWPLSLPVYVLSNTELLI